MNYFGPPYSFSIGVNHYEGMTLDGTVAVVRPHILNMKERIKAVRETYVFVYQTGRFKSELPELNKFLDTGSRLISDYDLILEQLNKRDIRVALACTSVSDKTYHDWAEELDKAVNQKTINSVVHRLEQTQGTLEFIRDGCIAIDATLVGIAITGVGVGAIVARAVTLPIYQGLVSLAQNESSVIFDLKQDLDLKGLGVEFVFNFIFSNLGGILRQKLVGKLLGTRRIDALLKEDEQLAEMLGIKKGKSYLLLATGARRLAEAIAHVVVNRPFSILKDSIVKIIKEKYFSQTVPHPNWDNVLDTVAGEIENLTWQKFFWDLVRSQLRASLQNQPR